MATLNRKGLLGLCVYGISAWVDPVWAQPTPEWQPHVLIVESPADAQAWIDTSAAERAGDSGRLRQIPTGLKIHFPIVVTGIPAGRALRLDADIEFLGPQGQVLWSRKSCCGKTVRDTDAATAVALETVASAQFEPNDSAGTYSIRAVVTDGQRSATAVETFRFGEANAAGAKPRGVRLQMAEPPKKNPGVDRDVRDCLALPTPGEVIKCTERKK
jgi:hypothetical protein